MKPEIKIFNNVKRLLQMTHRPNILILANTQ